MTASRCVSPDEQYTDQERVNRDVVLEFYEAGVNRRDYAAAFRHLADHYIQHNPNVADGREGFREFFDFMQHKFPKFRVEIKRIFIEGDMVAVHVRSFDGPTPTARRASISSDSKPARSLNTGMSSNRFRTRCLTPIPCFEDRIGSAAMAMRRTCCGRSRRATTHSRS